MENFFSSFCFLLIGLVAVAVLDLLRRVLGLRLSSDAGGPNFLLRLLIVLAAVLVFAFGLRDGARRSPAVNNAIIAAANYVAGCFLDGGADCSDGEEQPSAVWGPVALENIANEEDAFRACVPGADGDDCEEIVYSELLDIGDGESFVFVRDTKNYATVVPALHGDEARTSAEFEAAMNEAKYRASAYFGIVDGAGEASLVPVFDATGSKYGNPKPHDLESACVIESVSKSANGEAEFGILVFESGQGPMPTAGPRVFRIAFAKGENGVWSGKVTGVAGYKKGDETAQADIAGLENVEAVLCDRKAGAPSTVEVVVADRMAFKFGTDAPGRIDSRLFEFEIELGADGSLSPDWTNRKAFSLSGLADLDFECANALAFHDSEKERGEVRAVSALSRYDGRIWGAAAYEFGVDKDKNPVGRDPGQTAYCAFIYELARGEGDNANVYEIDPIAYCGDEKIEGLVMQGEELAGEGVYHSYLVATDNEVRGMIAHEFPAGCRKLF